MKFAKQYFFLCFLSILVACAGETEKNESATSSTTEKKAIDNLPKNPNKNLYWGDTHLHTTNSPDAFSFGARLTPDDANYSGSLLLCHIF